MKYRALFSVLVAFNLFYVLADGHEAKAFPPEQDGGGLDDGDLSLPEVACTFNPLLEECSSDSSLDCQVACKVYWEIQRDICDEGCYRGAQQTTTIRCEELQDQMITAHQWVDDSCDDVVSK